MSELDERVEHIVSVMVESAGAACETEGRDGVIELTLAATAVAVRFAIAGAGDLEGAKKVLAIMMNDYFAQAENGPAN